MTTMYAIGVECATWIEEEMQPHILMYVYDHSTHGYAN
jgi:hypothetical protein